MVEGQVWSSKAEKEAHAQVDRALAMLSRIDLVEFGRRLHSMVNVELSNPSRPDGYPSSTPGAVEDTKPAPAPRPCFEDLGNGERVLRHPVGETCDECVALRSRSTVETAVVARDAQREVDEFARKLEAALQYVEQASSSMQAAVNKLAEVDRLRASAGLTPGAPGCWALARIGAWEPVLHEVVVDDGSKVGVGRWAWNFRRSQGRLPNREECRAHVENPGGRVRPKV